MKGNVLLLSLLLFVGRSFAMDDIYWQYDFDSYSSSNVSGENEADTIVSEDVTASQALEKESLRSNVQSEFIDNAGQANSSRIHATLSWLGNKFVQTQASVVTAIRNHKVATVIIGGIPITYIGYKLWNHYKKSQPEKK